jgi:hypothetical protein
MYWFPSQLWCLGFDGTRKLTVKPIPCLLFVSRMITSWGGSLHDALCSHDMKCEEIGVRNVEWYKQIPGFQCANAYHNSSDDDELLGNSLRNFLIQSLSRDTTMYWFPSQLWCLGFDGTRKLTVKPIPCLVSRSMRLIDSLLLWKPGITRTAVHKLWKVSFD